MWWGSALNATDTLLVVPRFPAYAGQRPIPAGDFEPWRTGGQRRRHLRPPWVESPNISERLVTTRRGAHSTRKPAVFRQSTWSTCRCGKGCAKSIRLYHHRPHHGRAHGAPGAGDDCLRLEASENRAGAHHLRAGCLHIDGHDTQAVEHAAAASPAPPECPSPWTWTPSITASTVCCRMSTTSSPAPSFPVQWTNQSDPFPRAGR